MRLFADAVSDYNHDGFDDRRGLQDLGYDALWELWKDHGFEPARTAIAQQMIGESRDAHVTSAIR